MKISIITVVYNNKATLNDAISSVKSQSIFNNVEYIIVDGGSNDGTLEIISSNKQYIDIFISEKDKGIYDAMNKGINKATGDIIGILNSDDIYFDNKVLEDVISHFSNDLNLQILYGDLVYVDKFNTNKVVRSWKSIDYFNEYFERGNVPPHPSLFLRKNVYNEIGLFNLKYKLAADYELMLRLFKSNKFKSLYINRIIVKMRLGGATNRSLRNIINGNIEIYKSWKDNNYSVPFFLFFYRVYKRFIQFL